MKKYIGFLVLFYSFTLNGQRENDLWFFRPNTVIDFGSGAPLVREEFNEMYYYKEGNVVVCDPEGALLFYSQGAGVYNKVHQVMPASLEIPFDSTTSSSQQCTAIKLSQNNEKYAMLTVGQVSTQGELYFYVIDMSLNDGLGGVLKESIIKLGEDYTEQMYVVPHPCFGFWAVVHKQSSNTFHSYHFFGSKVISKYESKVGNGFLSYDANVIQITGSIYISDNSDLYYLDGRGTFEKLKFDGQSGKISDVQNFYMEGDGVHFYQGAFSPSGQFFYVYSSGNGQTWIGQYDVTKTSKQAIVASLVKLKLPPNGTGLCGLMKGPDGKIYLMCGRNNYSIGVVNEPNNPGLDCNFENKGLILKNRIISKGLPTPLVFETPKIDGFLPNDTAICMPTMLSVDPDIDFDSIRGSTNEKTASIMVRKTATYTANLYRSGCKYTDSIKVVRNYQKISKLEMVCTNEQFSYHGQLYQAGGQIVDTLNGKLEQCDTILTIDLLSEEILVENIDIAICEGTNYMGPNGLIYGPGDVVTFYKVGNEEHCDTMVNSTIKALPLPKPTISGEEIICFGTETDLTSSLHKAYQWSTGEATSSINVGGGNYDLTVIDSLNCEGTSSIKITERPLWVIDLLDTINMADGETYTLLLSGDKDRIDNWEVLPDDDKVTIYSTSIDIQPRKEGGVYKMVFKDNIGCMVEHNLYIEVDEKEESIHKVTSNVLSRSAILDQNRYWQIPVEDKLVLASASVYDRWGNRVFYAQDRDETWDGNFAGRPVAIGVYTYRVSGIDQNGDNVVKKGYVLVLE